MDWHEAVLLFAGGVLAGTINVLAGGAGFMTFPLLIAAGMTELQANASNFVALLPANLAGLVAYRHELRRPNLKLGWRLALAAVGFYLLRVLKLPILALATLLVVATLLLA